RIAAAGAFSMKRIALIIFGSLVVFVVAACGGGNKEVPADAVAVVGSKQVPKSAYDALVAQTKRNYEATKRPFPKAGSVALANLRTVFVQFLVQANEYQQ